MRKNNGNVFLNFKKDDTSVSIIEQKALAILRRSECGKDYFLCLLNFSEEEVDYVLPDYPKIWKKIIDSKEKQWKEHKDDVVKAALQSGGDGLLKVTPLSATIFRNE